MIWRRSGGVVHRTLAGTSVLSRCDDPELVVLRSIASLVWVGTAIPGSVEELTEDLRTIDAEVTEAEVETDLQRLAAFGFVQADND